jgi:AraC family transcriptional regulator
MSNYDQQERKIREAFQLSSMYLDPDTNNPTWRIRMKQTSNLEANVEVKEFPEATVAYVRHVGPYKGDSALFERLWGTLCKWAGPRGYLSAPDVKFFSVYHDNPEITEDSKLRISICVSVPEDTKTSGEIGKMSLKGGMYAVARFELDADQYSDAWAAVYAGWLPESGYQPADSPTFEWNHNDPKEHPEGKHIVSICVPVKPL